MLALSVFSLSWQRHITGAAFLRLGLREEREDFVRRGEELVEEWHTDIQAERVGGKERERKGGRVRKKGGVKTERERDGEMLN